MLVEPLGPPGILAAFEQWVKIAAVDSVWRRNARGSQQRGSEIDVQRHLILNRAAAGSRQPGVVYKKRNADRFFVRKPFSCQTMLGEIKAIVTREDNYGVRCRSHLLELLANTANHCIHFGQKPIIIPYGFLKQARCTESNTPAAARLRAVKLDRQHVDVTWIGRLGDWEADPLIEMLRGGRGQELARVLVLHMACFEADREIEWLLLWRAPKKFERLVAHEFGEVFARFALREVAPLTGKAAPVVEFRGGHDVTYSVLADEAGVIA